VFSLTLGRSAALARWLKQRLVDVLIYRKKPVGIELAAHDRVSRQTCDRSRPSGWRGPRESGGNSLGAFVHDDAHGDRRGISSDTNWTTSDSMPSDRSGLTLAGFPISRY
jgi:hypothetical protein